MGLSFELCERKIIHKRFIGLKKGLKYYKPLIINIKCDPDGIQTHDLQNRNLTLYSTKLLSQYVTKVEK